MKKILISLSILLLMSGCDNEDKMLSCCSTSESNGVTTNTKYEIKYQDDEVKHVKITYDYNQISNNNTADGANADTDGITEETKNNTNDNDNNNTTDNTNNNNNDNTNNNNNDNDLNADDVVDGIVGDAIDGTVNGIKDTILDLAGIKNTYQNQMSNYDNIEGFSYKVDVDNDNEYKIIYDIDMDKISDSDLNKFNVTRDFSDIKSNYQDLGYTCE